MIHLPTKCAKCGKNIPDMSLRYVLGLMNDPQFCSRECCRKWIVTNREKVDDYLLSVFLTATREG